MNNYSDRTLTVTQLNTFIKGLLDTEPILADIFVRGEISNFKAHSSGHFYFTLKDEGGALRAVMFRSSAIGVGFMPENGMRVIAHGRISAFVRDGQYQLYADEMEPDGIGSLYLAFEQLKAKLEAEGLFSEKRKKPLPKIPSVIGVITSPTGAALRDIINITGRRFPFAKIRVYPALVQGADASQSLVRALRYFNSSRSADVIIIGRGGGSIEDLWGFNNEALARAIAASEIPVISAVGHETDFTICDFVADKRAPTPSAAAELAVPDTAEMIHRFENIVVRERAVLTNMLAARRAKLAGIASSRALTSPYNTIEDKRMTVLDLARRAERQTETVIERCRARLANAAGKLTALDPLAVLARGYAAVFDESGAVIKSVAQINVGDTTELRLADGTAKAKILGITESENENER